MMDSGESSALKNISTALPGISTAVWGIFWMELARQIVWLHDLWF